MILSRELGKRIWGGSTNMENGGGGVSSDAIAGLLAGYATETWVDEHYISIDFFSRLFQAHGTENGSEIDVMPNDMETTITSVESMFGFWTNLYISALGSNGAAPAGISLGMLTDVTISGTPSAGQVLTFDAVTQKWINGNATGASSLATLTDVTLTSLQTNQILIYDANTQKWVNSSVKTINGNSIFGTGDIPASGGGGGAYLPLYGGGTITNGFVRLINCDYRCFSAFKSDGSNGTYGQIFNLGSGSSAGVGAENGILSLFNNQTEVVRLYANEYSYSFINSYKFGVGTVEPAEKLHVVGNIAIGTPGYSAYIGVPYNASNMSVINRIQFAAGAVDGSCIHYYGGTFASDPTLSSHKFSVVYIDNAFVIKNSGYVGIGTDSPSNKLSLVGGAISIDNTTQQVLMFQDGGVNKGYVSYHSSYGTFLINLVADSAIKIQNDGNVLIGAVSGSASYKLQVSGAIYATGAITALSDARKKDITGEAGVTVEQIAHAPAVQFLWKDKERRKDGQQVGTLAQYWRKVLPEVVMDKGGELSMQYGVTALVSAIVTARKVVDHERRIHELEKENDRLKEEISQLRLLN